MNPKRLIVTAEEARRLHAGEMVEVWRPAPIARLEFTHHDSGMLTWSCIFSELVRNEHGKKTVSATHSGSTVTEAQALAIIGSQYSPFPIGSRWWVAETCAIVPTTAYRYSEGVIQRVNPIDRYYSAIYKAGWDRSGKQPWQSSTQMPRWASRTLAEVTACRVELKDGTWYWVVDMKGEKS